MTRTFDSTIALIAAREVRERVRGRLFRVVTVLMLAAVAAAVVIPALAKSGTPTRTIGIAGTVPASSRAALAAAGVAADVHVVLVTEPSEDAARADLLSGRITIAVLGAREVMTKREIGVDDVSRTARLVRAAAATLGEERAFEAAGLTAAQRSDLANAKALPTTSLQPRRSKGSTQTASIVGVILLFLLLTQYNTWTLVGVMEEKASRVVEVLLATVRPLQLLAGKVLGIGLLVFAQAGLVVAVALGLGAAVGSDLLHGAGPSVVVSSLGWLVLGYAFYSWIYAAIGSMAERQDQVQALAVPVMVPMILGYVLALNVATSGTPSTLFTVLAYVPLTAPFAMPILVGLHDVAWWQVALAAAASIASTVAVALLAAAVYRRAVLRTGRRVSLREVLPRSAR